MRDALTVVAVSPEGATGETGVVAAMGEEYGETSEATKTRTRYQ